MSVLYTLIGAAFIIITLRDIYQELFDPNAYGRLSHLIKRSLWPVFRQLAVYDKRILSLAGPMSVITIILGWVLLLAVGWALVILPHLPQAFLLSTGLAPPNNAGFISAVYVSTVTMVTLGYGDITPTGDWFRILLPLEALTGMVVLTASVTWVLSLYPVIDRRRSFAHMISLVRHSEAESGEFGKDEEDAQTLETLSSQLIDVVGDLKRFPVTYYFHEDNEQTDLPAVMPKLLHLAENGAGDRRSALRRRAAMLRKATEDLASVLVTQRFVDQPSASVDEVLEAYARDHLYAPTKSCPEEPD